MLDELFMGILDMSKTGSIAILIVLAARLLLKRAPKVFSYALWAVVLLRLLCPLSFGHTTVSLIPEIPPTAQDYTLSGEPITVLEAGNAALNAVGDALNGGLDVQHIHTTELEADGTYRVVTSDWSSVWILFGQYVWLAGAVFMVLRSLLSYRKLRYQTETAIALRDNLYLADGLESPFVVGLIHPKIYLPSDLSQREYDYIILHEQHHIRRGDHVVKALAFLALCLHWFNPLVWLAFHLASRDMEMSCDEAVVRKLGSHIRADYAASLLTLATGRRIVAGTPLAFGEGDPKGRIRNLAKWKKPAAWVLVLALLICMILGVCLMTDQSIREDRHVGVTFYFGNVTAQTDSVIHVMCHDGNQRTFHYEADNEDIPKDLAGKQVRIRARQQDVTGLLIATSAEEVPDARFDTLQEAIQTVILAHHSIVRDPEVLDCASFYTFASGDSANLVRKYGIVYHQGYRLEDGHLVEDGGCNVPTVLTFRLDEDGAYTLAEYWEPRDGSHYPEDIRAKYPAFVWPDTQKNMFGQKTAIFSQVMEGFRVGPAVVADHLITDICDRERWAGSFDDLMEMCELQRELLGYYREETLAYCFDQFRMGGQTGTRGKVMAHVCREIMEEMGEVLLIDPQPENGQEWFDAFAANAGTLLEQFGSDDLKAMYPASWLYLKKTGSLPPEEIVSSAMANGFEIRLYSGKDTYAAGEEINLWATLEYSGEEERVTIWHGQPYMVFSITDGEGFNSGGMVATILTSSKLNRGEVYRFNYAKSGGYDPAASDAEFWEDFYADPALRLPAGTYTIRVSGDFFLSHQQQAEEQGPVCELQITVTE